MWPPPQTKKDDPSSFLFGASILVALSHWCIIFICVVYDGRNVWVLSDHSWNTCMYRLNVVGMIKVVDIILDEVRKCVTLTVGSCLCTARSKRLAVWLFLQCCRYLCSSVGMFCFSATSQCSRQNAILGTGSLGHEDTYCSFPLKGSMHFDAWYMHIG